MRLNATTRKLPSGCAFPANFTTGGLISPRLFLGWRLHNMLSIIAFIGGAAIGGIAVGIPAVLEIRRINSRGWEWYHIAENAALELNHIKDKRSGATRSADHSYDLQSLMRRPSACFSLTKQKVLLIVSTHSLCKITQ